MSLSKMRPGSQGNPLVVDENGHLVERGASRRRRQRIFESPPPVVNTLRMTTTTTVRAARNAANAVAGPSSEPSAARMAADRVMYNEDRAEECREAQERAHERAVVALRAQDDTLQLLKVPTHNIDGRRLSRRKRLAHTSQTVVGPVAPAQIPAPFVRSAERVGLRICHVPALTADALYKSDARLADYKDPKQHHLCGICKGVKDHPVSYVCGHSHCYACIRVWLEKGWKCPECQDIMHCPPFRHYGEESGLADTFPGWADASEIEISWVGLHFPKAPANRA
ncbi:hypothetical protein C8F04DRAFT_1258194 [Mycena alexandri]|uniref:RING-type domain-containing protein n=1 Tax=Mycena alexandri TaxID=1745969 RepID=A0AAD6SXW0_9AGAR|nr:hypothetical protein C8F04DRAFT_1258194 [Mycena alexandri]